VGVFVASLSEGSQAHHVIRVVTGSPPMLYLLPIPFQFILTSLFDSAGASKEDSNSQPNQAFLLKAALKLRMATVDDILPHGYDQ
jgi:hypothetical protein